jgi:DNA-binding NarL/FixJ family response regulator
MRAGGVRNLPRGPRAATRRNPAELAAPQMEVLYLLAEGLQNAQIAERLFISPGHQV